MQTTILENFPLNWRWTDSKYCLLSSEELARITPIDTKSAKSLWKQSLTFSSKDNDFSPDEGKFQDIESIECVGTVDVPKWLKQKIPTGKIIISWQPDTAVITDSDLFIKYWGEFCYPSSDDVSIWSETEEWILHYWHEEVFWYGKSINT